MKADTIRYIQNLLSAELYRKNDLSRQKQMQLSHIIGERLGRQGNFDKKEEERIEEIKRVKNEIDAECEHIEKIIRDFEDHDWH